MEAADMSEFPEPYDHGAPAEPVPVPDPESVDAPKHFLNIAEIFATPKVVTEDVFVPQWNGWVRVKGLTAAERDAFEESLIKRKGKNQEINRQNVRARLIARTVVNPETGKLMFRDMHAEQLGQLLAGPMDLLFDTAQRLSGFRDEDIEDLGKPSEETSDGDSSSG